MYKSLRLLRLPNTLYVFTIGLTFYFSLWIINPGNKVIVASFLLLFLLLYIRLKELRISLLLTYFFSLVVLTGKEYLIEFATTRIYDKYLFPDGSKIVLTVTPSHILSVFLFIIILRDLTFEKLKKLHFNKRDILVLFYFLWLFISDYFGSKQTDISLIISVLTLHSLISYFFVRFYIEKKKIILPLLLTAISSLIIFESTMSFMQFINESPLSKNLEKIVTIDTDQFGLTSDDLSLVYRPAGTFSQANELAMWLIFFVCILVPFVFKNVSNLYSFTAVVGLIAILITLSRSGWLSLFMGILFILFILEKIRKERVVIRKLDIKFIIFLLPLFLLLFVLLNLRISGSLFTFSSGTGLFRREQIESTFKLIYANPIFGVGSGMSIQESALINSNGIFSHIPLAVHNWYLLMLAEHGWPLFIAFLLLTLLSLKKMYLEIIKNEKNFMSYFKIGVFGGIISVLTMSLFQPFLVIGYIFLFYAIF